MAIPVQLLAHVVSGEPLVIGLHHIPPLFDGDGSLIRIKVVGEQEVRSLLVVPLQLLPAQREYAPHDQAQTPVGVLLRVRQGERRPPRPAKDDPFLDPQVLSQLLDVFNEMPGRVVL